MSTPPVATEDPSAHPLRERIPVQAPGHWLFGLGPELSRDPLAALTRLGKLGEVVRLRLGPFTAFLLNNPEHIKRVFQDHRVFNKQNVSYLRLSPLLGQGLITSDGDLWLRQRRIAQPAFHRQRIAGFAELMARAAEALCERWRPHAASGEPLDVAAEMTHVTMQVVCETLLGGDMGRDGEVVTRSFGELNRLILPRVTTLLPLPLWVPTRANRRFRRALADLDGTVYRVIARRRAEKRETNDLLSMLMHARDEENGGQMSDRQLRDELVTMLLAGHETTAVALAWSLYLLSQHPDIEARLRAELAEVLGGRAPGLADLERLRYTRMVIDETMRLYPPVYNAMRLVAEDVVLDGYRIPRGVLVMVSSWVVHRLPSLWEAPEEFRPERFAPEHAEALPRYAYFPFIGGPRQCIGNSFALMEAQLVLATIVGRYRLAMVPGHPVEMEPLLTLRPKHGLRMTIAAA